MFTLRPSQYIHMCCINNRNTSGCDRIKICSGDIVIGYVLLEDADKIPAYYTNTYNCVTEYADDIVDEVKHTKYESILAMATEAKEAFDNKDMNGIEICLRIIINLAKQGIEAKNE